MFCFAQLEGSKEFAKEFLFRHNIPTASYASFNADSVEEGYAFLETLSPPYVLKADGLAAGKGVVILNDINEAKEELKQMLVESKFGLASQKVVIEEFLDGIELSCFVLTDGEHYKILPTAKDYKRIGEGDKGLNTGGMGAYSPSRLINKNLIYVFKLFKTQSPIYKIDKGPFEGCDFISILKLNLSISITK